MWVILIADVEDILLERGRRRDAIKLRVHFDYGDRVKFYGDKISRPLKIATQSRLPLIPPNPILFLQ